MEHYDSDASEILETLLEITNRLAQQFALYGIGISRSRIHPGPGRSLPTTAHPGA